MYTDILFNLFGTSHICRSWSYMDGIKDVQVSDWKPICGGNRDPNVVKHQMSDGKLQIATSKAIVRTVGGS